MFDEQAKRGTGKELEDKGTGEEQKKAKRKKNSKDEV